MFLPTSATTFLENSSRVPLAEAMPKRKVTPTSVTNMDEAVGDFLGAHAAAGTQNEGNAQGQETKVNLFNEADGDHDHQNNETDNRKIHLFFSL